MISRAFKGGGESFAKDCVLGCVQGDMGDVDFQVLIRVGFVGIAIKGEWFPLGRERCVSDKICEWVAASGLVREGMWGGWLIIAGKVKVML